MDNFYCDLIGRKLEYTHNDFVVKQYVIVAAWIIDRNVRVLVVDSGSQMSTIDLPSEDHKLKI